MLVFLIIGYIGSLKVDSDFISGSGSAFSEMRKSSGSGFFSLSLACFFLTLHSSTKSAKTNLANVLTFPKTKKISFGQRRCPKPSGQAFTPPFRSPLSPPTCNAHLNRPLFSKGFPCEQETIQTKCKTCSWSPGQL